MEQSMLESIKDGPFVEQTPESLPLSHTYRYINANMSAHSCRTHLSPLNLAGVTIQPLEGSGMRNL